ncbi:MAG: DUF1127 domain-containing protein [Alphaproteobacteria bacterium]|nr:DUF1127 domain-containing protein [Alphaproteobacteria bacterium]
MTVTELHPTRGCRGRARHAEALSGLSDAGQWLRATLREWHRRIRDRGELAGLSDRMLHDIGLSRSDAVYLSSKPFWRE